MLTGHLPLDGRGPSLGCQELSAPVLPVQDHRCFSLRGPPLSYLWGLTGFPLQLGNQGVPTRRFTVDSMALGEKEVPRSSDGIILSLIHSARTCQGLLRASPRPRAGERDQLDPCFPRAPPDPSVAPQPLTQPFTLANCAPPGTGLSSRLRGSQHPVDLDQWDGSPGWPP